MKQIQKNNNGFTLIEILVVLGIFLIVTGGAVALLTTSIRSNAVIWEQLATQNDGRQVIQEVVGDVRRAEVSSIGSYPLDTVAQNELIFYANIDGAPDRERIRYWHTNTNFFKGVTKPTGSPLRYMEENEQVKLLAEDVKNIEKGVPVFEYYANGYTGTQSPLSVPVERTDVRMVRVSLELEEDPTKTPVPLHVEALAQIRNLKDN